MSYETISHGKTSSSYYEGELRAVRRGTKRKRRVFRPPPIKSEAAGEAAFGEGYLASTEAKGTYNSAAASTLLAAQEPFLVYAQKQSYPSLSCEESQLLLASPPPSPPPTSITTTNTTTTTPPLLPSLPPPPLPTTTQLPARNLCLSASSLPPPPPSPLLYHHHHVTICL